MCSQDLAPDGGFPVLRCTVARHCRTARERGLGKPNLRRGLWGRVGVHMEFKTCCGHRPVCRPVLLGPYLKKVNIHCCPIFLRTCVDSKCPAAVKKNNNNQDTLFLDTQS